MGLYPFDRHLIMILLLSLDRNHLRVSSYGNHWHFSWRYTVIYSVFGNGDSADINLCICIHWVTPHPEFKLIRENNLAASVAFAGSLVGFSLPLASVIAHSVALTDCVIWGLIAILVQIIIFFLVRLPIPGISERIEKGETSSGLWLGATSLTGGLLNAACMSP